ncbi:MAG: single-stranded-DNA-specific exonuclease RecJ, partial [Nitrospirota bacterium]
MVKKRWIFRQVDREQQVALAHTLSISLITASVLLARGVSTKEQAHSWLSPHQTALHDPFLLP